MPIVVFNDMIFTLHLWSLFFCKTLHCIDLGIIFSTPNAMSTTVPAPTPASSANSPASLVPAPIAVPPSVRTSSAPVPSANPPLGPASSVPAPSGGISSAPTSATPAASASAPPDIAPSTPAANTPADSVSPVPAPSGDTPSDSASATPAANATLPPGTPPSTPASSPSHSGSSVAAPSGDTPSAPASSTPAASADMPSAPSAPAASPPSDSGSSVPAPSGVTPSVTPAASPPSDTGSGDTPAPGSTTPAASADPPSGTSPSTPAAIPPSGTAPSTPAATPPSGSGSSLPTPSGDTPLTPVSTTPAGSADPPSGTAPSTPAATPPSGSGSSLPTPSGDTPLTPVSTTPAGSADPPSGTSPSTPAATPPSGSGSSLPTPSGDPSAPASTTPPASGDPPSGTALSTPADVPPSSSGSSVPAPSGDTPSAPASATPAASADPPSGTAPSTPAGTPLSGSGSSVPASSGDTPSTPASTTPAASADAPSGTSPSTPAAVPPSGSGSSVPASSGDTPSAPAYMTPAPGAGPTSGSSPSAPATSPPSGSGSSAPALSGDTPSTSISASPTASADTPSSTPAGPASDPASTPTAGSLSPVWTPRKDRQVGSTLYIHFSDADCVCEEGYTNTPPGSPWRCVVPMQATLQLEISLEVLFPLVSELARELANELLLLQSQVRIVGANAVDPDLDQTDVNADFVPLHQVFDNSTAVLLASRLWTQQVMLDKLLFGPSYKVVRVQYPGLPPFPGSKAPHASSPQTNRGTTQGVGTKKGGLKMSHKKISLIAVASAIGIVISLGVIWFMRLWRCGLWEGSVAVIEPVSMSTSRQSEQHPAGDLKLPGMSTTMFESGMPVYTGSTRRFSLAELERATEKFKIDNIVGEGGFGRVYRGVLDNGVCVAIKVLTCVHQQGNYEFIAEVEMLSRLHHRNLVTLIGICTENHTCFLVYEFVPNGSVESHLHGADRLIAPLEWKARVKIALGAARGLAYLHEDSIPRVIHRDFKASNILLEDDFTPKVSDFGLAKEAADGGKSQHVSTRVMGTFGYVAPEYAMTGHLLVKSDVYSYGVVLLELLSGRKPVDISQPHGQENLVTWARPLLCSKEGLEMLVDSGLHNNFHFDDYRRMAAIAWMCVQPEVSHRPSMGEVVQALLPLFKNSTAASDSSPQEEFSAPGRTGISVATSSQPNSQNLSSTSINSSDYDSEPLHHQNGQSLSSEISTGSGRHIRQLIGSFHHHSTSFISQTPLRNKPAPQSRDRGMKAVAKSDHGSTRDRGKQKQRGFSNCYWA
ncbi:unnamed protein product [Sphagnum jensenii]|uniref:Protein kinase domain-containing protein n=1 Tax=Sphagnum jensenii TaxID=128206 RepID=A0ABP1BJZ7_9BRYO